MKVHIKMGLFKKKEMPKENAEQYSRLLDRAEKYFLFLKKNKWSGQETLETLDKLVNTLSMLNNLKPFSIKDRIGFKFMKATRDKLKRNAGRYYKVSELKK